MTRLTSRFFYFPNTVPIVPILELLHKCSYIHLPSSKRVKMREKAAVVPNPINESTVGKENDVLGHPQKELDAGAMFVLKSKGH